MSKMMRKKKQEVLYMGDDTGLYMEMQGAGFLEGGERYNRKYEYDEDNEFEDGEEVVFKRFFWWIMKM